MKRTAVVALVISLITVFAASSMLTSAHAWKPKIPGIGGKKKSAAPVDLNAVNAKDKSIRQLVAKAAESFLMGAAKVMEAVGAKEKAEKYKAAVTDLLKNREDPQNIKDALNKVDEGNEDLKAVKEEKKELDAEGRKLLGKGLIYVGAGGLADIQAGQKTAEFVDTLKTSIDTVKGDPIKYGAKAVKQLKESLSLMTFLSKTLPKQGSAIGKTFSTMTKYAKTQGVTISDKDAEEEMDGWDEEG